MVNAGGILPPFGTMVVDLMAFQSATTFPAFNTEAKARVMINRLSERGGLVRG